MNQISGRIYTELLKNDLLYASGNIVTIQFIMELTHSILNSLSPDDVQELIEQEVLIKKNKVKIHYAIDHHEVSEFCFPLGFTEGDQAIDLDLMADRQAALNHLFREHRVLFFEEYDRELNRLFEFINATLEKQLRNDIQLLLHHLTLTQQDEYQISESDANRKVYLRQIISERLPLILAICLGFAKDGVNKLRTLDESKLLFDYNDVKESQYWPSFIAEAINHSKSRLLAVQLLRDLQGDKSESLHNRLLDAPSLREFTNRTRRNIETDCKVIARVLQLNRFLYNCYKEKITPEWHFFQLISSTTLFNKLTRLDSYKRQLIDEEGIKLSPYRTLSQRYLWMLCEGENRKKELENFKQYREFEMQKDTFRSLLISELRISKSSLTEDFFERIQTVRNNYEYTGLFANYLAAQPSQVTGEGTRTPVRQLLDRFNSLKKSKKQTLNNKDNQQEKDYYLQETQALYEDMLMVIEKEGPTNITKLKTDKLWLSNELRQESSYQNRLLNGLNDLQKKLDDEENKFYVLRGKDPVQGAFQHLPIAFNVSEQHQTTLQHTIDNFLRLSLDRLQLKAIFEQLLTSSIDEDINYGSSDTIITYTPKYEEKLIRFIVILLVPRQELRQRPDEDLFSWVVEVINRLENDKKHPEIINFHQETALRRISVEYYYMAAWLARRLEKYDQSKFYADKGRSISPDDVRFTHALCLIVYCNALKAISEQEDQNLLQIIKWLNECYKLSENALEILSSPRTKEFTVHVNDYLKASLQNTSAYVKALLAQYDNMQAHIHLQDGKGRLDDLKKFPNYDHYPEFLHTEAVMLYQMLYAPEYIIDENIRWTRKKEGITAIKTAILLKQNIKGDNRLDDYADWLKKLDDIN